MCKELNEKIRWKILVWFLVNVWLVNHFLSIDLVCVYVSVSVCVKFSQNIYNSVFMVFSKWIFFSIDLKFWEREKITKIPQRTGKVKKSYIKFFLGWTIENVCVFVCMRPKVIYIHMYNTLFLILSLVRLLVRP